MAQPVSGQDGTWRDEFAGTVLRPVWKVRTVGSGMTASVASSKLTIATGTTSGDVLELVSEDMRMKPPCRLIVSLDSISQRIANQEFSIELIRVDTLVDAVNTDSAGFYFIGTNVAQGDVRTVSQGDAQTLASQTWPTSAGAVLFEIDLTTDEVWFYGGTVDTFASAKTNSIRFTRKVPDPAQSYMVRIRAKNTGVPASNTNFVIDSVLVEDYSAFSMEIARARGSSAAGEQLPVVIAGFVAGMFRPNALWWDESTTPLAGAATFTGSGRDVMNVAANSNANAAATAMPARFRGWAVSDVTGTLYIAASRDNSTFYRVDAQPAALVGSNYVAWLELPVLTRYARVEYVNGAGAQGTFVIGSQATAVS